MKIPLETKVKDKITGFEGVVTARCEYFTGCVLYEVIPLALKDGIPQKEQWLDAQRLEVVEEKRKATIKPKVIIRGNRESSYRPRGGPQNHPSTRSHPFEA